MVLAVLVEILVLVDQVDQVVLAVLVLHLQVAEHLVLAEQVDLEVLEVLAVKEAKVELVELVVL